MAKPQIPSTLVWTTFCIENFGVESGYVVRMATNDDGA
jgi:hypothetical protein